MECFKVFVHRLQPHVPFQEYCMLLVIKYYIPLLNLFLRFIGVPNLRQTIN